MRSTRWIIIGCILALTALPALAQQSGGMMGGQQDMGAGAQMQQAQGPVSNIDQQNKTLQVQDKTLHFSDATRVEMNGQPAQMSSLKEGDQVRASYMNQNGKDVAQKIDIVSGAGAMAPPAGGGAGGQAPSGGQPSGGAPSGGGQPSGY